ncbi:MAG: M1 family metallopeptidase [Elusimicrobia bacterium]|nr:M1 family metallopeptidase [Elusimicrobiota bacterium]
MRKSFLTVVCAALALATVSVQAKPLYFGDERLLPESGAWAKPERFKSAGPRFRRDREVDILHIKLEIALDFQKQSFEAAVTQRFKALGPGVNRLELDAQGLDIRKVTGARGEKLDFEVLPEKLVVHFPKALAAGEEGSIRIEYAGSPRHMGLHFFKADERYPGQPDMVWSQGEAEENRFWIPLYDYPNERVSTEVVATVPEGFTAVSNGKLLSQGPGPKPGTRAFHWLQERPHVAYLVTLSAARFVPVALSAPEPGKGVPMTVWALPGQEEDAKRTFARTPDMVRYFSELLDAPYPWEKYDQVLVYEFFGGMENTSATNILDRALLDSRASLDHDSDDLISHELAHQWFGDLVTCKDWSHIWLNEGVTSYFQALWKRKDKGADEFAYDLHQKAQRYFGEHGSYQRAVVTERYEIPMDMFDAHTYNKGAWVLHMLRMELGEDLFWKSFKRYLRERQDSVAETEDLRRAVEETTGKSMLQFFNQWLYGPGYPFLLIKEEWDPIGKELKLRVIQKQAKDGMPVFRFKLPLQFDKDGKKVVAEVSKEEESFSWPLGSRPRMIRLDPEQSLLAEYKLEFPEDMLISALREDLSVSGRLRALSALGKLPSPKALAAIGQCLLKDPFWGVAAACAAELGKIGGPKALAALKEGARSKHSKVRAASASALGQFLRQEEALEAVKPLAGKDPSYRVEAAALAALGSLRLPQSRALLEPKLGDGSWDQAIRRAALSGLGRLKEEATLPLLQDWAGPGKPALARSAALGALAEAGEGKEPVRDFLAMVLETEEDRVVRGAAIRALSSLGDPRANVSLSKIATRDPSPEVRRGAEEAIENIRQGKKGRIEELSKQVDGLVEKLDRFEKKLDELQKKAK